MTELDSHADTCCFGRGARVVQETGETIQVEPFINTIGRVTNVPVVTAAVAYDDPATFQTYILFFPQSLYMEALDKNLLNPNQMRNHQVTVNELPLSYTPHDERTTETHSIITRAPEHKPMHIPLQLEGVISNFETRKPTQREVETEDDCIHIWMTSEVEWRPSEKSLGMIEDKIRASLDGKEVQRDRSIHAFSTVDWTHD